MLSQAVIYIILTLSSQLLVTSFTTNLNVKSHKRSFLGNEQIASTSSSSEESPIIEGIDVSSDSRLYSTILSRATGIEWGTDLSFHFVYVRAIEPGSPASLSGVNVGDQICQLRPVNNNELGAVQNLVGASFDTVMNSFALEKSVQKVELIFFRGTKEELIQAATNAAVNDDDDIVITVIENKGSKDEKPPRAIKAKKGCNIRKELVENGINVYQSFTRWTNCSGKQLCGTCIVNVASGNENTNRKSMDEESTLRENPDGYRLSCVSFAYGDVTVETFPPIKASQWTR